MSITLKEVRGDVLRRLGDTTETPDAARVWSEDEIDNYIRDGAREFCMATKILWDMRHVDDLPFTANYNAAWELPFFKVEEAIHGPASFSAPDDKDFQSTTPSPANHQYVDERDFFLTGVGDDLISSVERMPDSLYQVDRVTWDGFKAIPLQSRKMARIDNYFEVIRGRVFGYLLDRDGLRNIRKWKVPAARALYYVTFGKFGVLRASAQSDEQVDAVGRIHIDQFGMIFSSALDRGPSTFGQFTSGIGVEGFASIADPLTDLGEFGEDSVNWRPGILRRLPGYFPANGPRGFVKRLSQDGTNTRVEFYRRPHALVGSNSIFEIPDYMLMHVRSYALWKAFAKKGPGQDLKFAAHFKTRYAAGVARTIARTQAIYASKIWRMGGSGSQIYQKKPYAALPRNI